MKDHTTELLGFVVITGTALIAIGLFARWSRRNGLVLAEERARRDLLLLHDVTAQVVDKHVDALTRKRWQLLRVDDYGNEISDKWREQIGYFIDSVLSPTLDANQVDRLINEYDSIVRLIDTRVAAAQAQQERPTAYSDEMTPAEFESHCASALSLRGWSARVVGQSGDQGADVIAERDGVSVVIQCKRYAIPVGNSAVQEVFAAKTYQQATHAAVVTNASFTKAAKDLASTTGVLLLHPTDLDRLWSMVTVTSPQTRDWRSWDMGTLADVQRTLQPGHSGTTDRSKANITNLLRTPEDAGFHGFGSSAEEPIPIFPLTLHKTYLEHGFFNVTVNYDRYVRQTEGPVELVLLTDGKERRVEAHVNRSANRNGTARIMGGTKLRDWFLHHFDVGARLDVDLRSAAEIRIEMATGR